MRRLTDEKLGRYEGVLSRVLELGEFAEEDRPVLQRVERLYEEVANEVTSAS